MTGLAHTHCKTFDDAEELATATAAWLCELALARNGNFALCLSGGSTPRKLYEALARGDVAARFPWARSHWFWGDERFVPHDHPDSNAGMVQAALLARVPIPAENIHRIPTEKLSPADAAARYEDTLKTFYGAERLTADRPLFDVTLLGIGDDGHTASLFPGQPSLEECSRWVLDVKSPKGDPRITLTYPALQSSREVAFLATGRAKQAIIARARMEDPSLPAARLHPLGGLHWFLDRAASNER